VSHTTEPTTQPDTPNETAEPARPSDRPSSADMRLSTREWIAVLAIVMPVLIFLPMIWESSETFQPQADYRVPFKLSDDYWVYRRRAEAAAAEDGVLIIGDSVVWGEYVKSGGTLSAALNGRMPSQRFRNGGLSGTHPLALEGLVRHYAGSLSGRKVILHCNLLWIGSPERDLSLETKRDITFSHPRLIPQLSRRIPAYKVSWSERLGVTVDHAAPFRSWVQHMRIRSWDSLDMHSWSLDNPYRNPLQTISLELPQPQIKPRHGTNPNSWIEQGLERQDIPWVDLDVSLQWQAFKNTITILQQRDNELFVIVGPFNDHLLSDESRERYNAIKQRVEDWLSSQQMPYFAPVSLPSHLYGDASHPLREGYAHLAGQLSTNTTFRKWMGGMSGESTGGK